MLWICFQFCYHICFTSVKFRAWRIMCTRWRIMCTIYFLFPELNIEAWENWTNRDVKVQKKGKVKFYNTHLLRNEQKMTWCYKISAKGNFSKEIFFMSLWVVAFGKSWTLKYKFNPLMFIWHTSLFSALYIFRKSWREKSYKKTRKNKIDGVGWMLCYSTHSLENNFS